MRHSIYCFMFVLGLCTDSVQAQELPQIAQFLAQMKTAQISDGWSVRAEIVQTVAGENLQRHFKIAIVGQSSSQMTQLWIRPIFGDIAKNQQYFLLSAPHGVWILLVVDTLLHTRERHEIDLMTSLSDTGLYASDVLNVWLQLPYHAWGRPEIIGDRHCQNMGSSNSENVASGLRVVNCIDMKNNLVLKSQVFDEQGRAVRITTVEKTANDAKGRLQPQQTLTHTAEQQTQVSIYSADGQYQVTPDIFEPLRQYMATLHH